VEWWSVVLLAVKKNKSEMEGYDDIWKGGAERKRVMSGELGLIVV